MKPRRPLTISTIAFAGGISAAGLAAVHSCSLFLLSGTGIAVVLLFLCLIICKNLSDLGISGDFSHKLISGTLLILIFFLCGTITGISSFTHSSRLAAFADQEVSVTGTVTEVLIKESGTVSLTIRLSPGVSCRGESGEIPQPREKILVTVYHFNEEDPLRITGYPVTAHGTLRIPQGASNPAGFDYRSYLRSEKIYICMTAGSIEKLSDRPARPLLNKIAVFKSFYEKKLTAVLQADAAGMLCGILFGDKTLMDEELLEIFRQNGTGHLLAASGLHVGFVYAALNWLFRKPRTTAGNLPVFSVLILYAALAGFSSSVVRAVFMITVRIISKTSVQRYDFLTSISFCALVLLAYEPAYIFSAGFLLSFLAVTSLAVLLPTAEKLFHVKDQDEREMLPAEKIRYHFRKYLASTAALTLALQAGMVPVTLKNFHYISLAGLALNLPSIALAGIIVPAGLALIPLSFCPSVLYTPAALLEEMLVRLLIRINGLMSASGLSCLYRASPLTGIYLFLYFILFFSCSETGQRVFHSIRRHPGLPSAAIILMIFAAAASVCAGAGYTCDRDYLKSDLIFVDVGQGDCAHLKSGRENLLFDSGGSHTRDIGKETLMPYFLGNGVDTIDLAVISHLHTDHYEGLKTLAKYVRIRKLLVSSAYQSKLTEITRDTGLPASDIIFAVKGDRFTVGKTTIDILAPFPRSKEEFAKLAEDEEAENDCCLVAKAEYLGTSVIFTGDIDEILEKELVNYVSPQLNCDILKVAHHGSKYSSCSEFLTAASPSAAVIQVGLRNHYGHPTPEALERLEKCGAAIYRNDLQGAIMADLSEKGKLTFRTMKQE